MAVTLGFECVCAADGREALEIFDRERKPFDIVLTDLWMPEMNGMELAERIAAKTGGTMPIIAVTADTQIAGELPEGFAGVLLKPITPRTLGKAIREARRKR
jgi:CheY-like chemotaxis protein